MLSGRILHIGCWLSLLVFFLPQAACNSRAARPVQMPPENPEPAAVPEDDMKQPQMNLPRTLVTLRTPDGRVLTLEAQVASTPPQQAKGLMFRRHLPESEGMLFVYDREEELGFYMANCFISLDMIFMDRDRVVVGVIERAKPMDPTILSIGRPSQYVLEVNGGFAERHGIVPGTRITWNDASISP